MGLPPRAAITLNLNYAKVPQHEDCRDGTADDDKKGDPEDPADPCALALLAALALEPRVSV